MSTVNVSEIKPHARVLASCSTQVGIVDHLDGQDKIKLTKHDASDGKHHLIPVSWVTEINGEDIKLNKNSDEVYKEWQAV